MPADRTGKGKGKARATGSAAATPWPTLYNALLTLSNLDPALPWSNPTFQRLTGLSPLGFLDPAYRDAKRRELLPARIDGIRTYFASLESSSGPGRLILYHRAPFQVPGYKEFHGVAYEHFSRRGNLEDAIVKCMEENGASYAQALEVAGAGHAQMISAGDYSGAVIRPLLETLFGQDAFHQNHGHPGPSVPKPEYKSVAEALHYRMWERQVTQRERRERKAQWNADVDGATVTPDASAEYARPQPSTLGAPPNMNRKSEPGNEDQFNNSADAATIRTSASPFPPSFALSTPTSASASAPQLPLDFQQRPFVVLPPAVPPSVLSQIITNMNTRLLPADEFAYHFASCAGCGGVGTHRVVAEHQLDCVGSGTGEME